MASSTNVPSDFIHYFDLVIPALGIALFLCLIGRNIAKKFHIPKVSVFILIGIALGPSGFNILKPEMVHSLNLVSEAALGLILFNIGGTFNRDLLLKLNRQKLLSTLVMLHLVCFFVFSIFFVLSLFDLNISMQNRIIVSIFLSVIAVESAPPTTLLVMKEYNSKGPITQMIMVYLAIGTFMAVIGAKVLTSVLEMTNLWETSNGSVAMRILMIIWGVFGSILVGTAMGFILSYYERKEKKFSDIFFVVITAIVFAQSLAHFLKLDPLIISLTLGFAMVNSSDTGQRIHASIQSMGLSIYALFFVIAGAHIHLQEQIPTLGVLGASYIIARTVGIFMAGKVTGLLFKSEKENSTMMGLGLFSHAGAAIAIVTALMGRGDESAQKIITIIMTSIFVFEIAGPFSLKFSLKKAGEIEPSHGDNDKTTKSIISLTDVVENFLFNIGLRSHKHDYDINSLSNLVVTDIVAIQSNATLKTVKKYINENYVYFPVVDDEHRFLGSISIDALKDVIDDESSTLILAESLIRDKDHLSHTHSIQEAVSLFQDLGGPSRLPVIDEATKKFIGIIYYKDLLLHIAGQKNDRKVIG